MTSLITLLQINLSFLFNLILPLKHWPEKVLPSSTTPWKCGVHELQNYTIHLFVYLSIHSIYRCQSIVLTGLTDRINRGLLWSYIEEVDPFFSFFFSWFGCGWKRRRGHGKMVGTHEEVVVMVALVVKHLSVWGLNGCSHRSLMIHNISIFIHPNHSLMPTTFFAWANQSYI
jgi:hypothetical protein